MAAKRGHHSDIEDFIRDNYVNFTDNLEVDSVIPYLIKERILRRADKQKILKKDTQEEQTGELLDILSRNGKCTVEIFMNALEQTEQTALIDMLDVAPQYRKKRAVEAGVSSSQDDVSETAANPDQDDGKPVCSNPTGTPPAAMARAPDTEERSQEAAAGSSHRMEGSRKPRILLVHDEYGTSHGGISTINCEVGQLTAKDNQADVSCTVVHAPNLKDQRDAQNDHVQLIEPRAGAGPRNSKDPSKDWLYYHREHYPDLPNDVDCVIGHVDITDQAARKIQKDRYPQAKLITINHVIREKTEAYKGGRRPVDAWRREMDVLKEVTEEDVVFSVGKRIYNHYSTVYKGGKRPKSHQIFLPKPSDIFLNATVEVGIDGQLVVLSVGRVKEAERLKGHDLAAGSMGIVAEKIKDAAWRVCGINKDDYAASKKILEDNLKSGNLKPTLVEYGTQEEICANMKMAHLVLMPSRAEPFGLVGLEAIAAGIPVLISDKSGLADLIKDLIKNGKCSADMRHRIVETSVNESDLDKDAKKWADKILDTLENIGAEFENAAKYKKELMDSEYWVKSHQAFLQEACGITAARQ